MKRYCLLCLLLAVFCLPAQAQKKDKAARKKANSLKPEAHPNFGPKHCNDWQGYVPMQPEYFPVKRIRLVLHVIQKDDGTGNFQDRAEDYEFINRVIHHMNYVFIELDTMKSMTKVRNIPFIRDARLFFVVDTIFFHRSTEEWNYKKNCGYYDESGKDTLQDNSRTWTFTENLYMKYVAKQKDYPVRYRDSALNVFMLESKGMAGRGMANNLHSKRWLNIVGAYEDYKAPTGPNHWSLGRVMAHEIGHNMGLGHTFEGSGCSDAPYTPKGTTTNLMDAWPNQSHALTPCQLGLIHAGLSGHVGDLAATVIKDWCSYHADQTMYIHKGDTVKWSGDRFLLGDLVVEKGAVLLVQCRLSLPEGATVKIIPGGTMIIDGGVVTNLCGSKFGGFILEANKKDIFGHTRDSRSVLMIFNEGYFDNNQFGIWKRKFEKEEIR